MEVQESSQMNLHPIKPEKAVEQYLESRRYESSPSTVQNHRYRLKQFLRWCSETDFDDMREMNGRLAEKYKHWRRADADLAPVTIEMQMRTFRVFLKWCESNEYVTPGVADKIIIPSVSDAQKARDDSISVERAEEILTYLRKYEYATLRHVLFHLLWHTGIRTGAAHALDVDDWHSDEGYISVQHRPETDTPLKLQERGERHISITKPSLHEAIDDYLEINRPEVTDEHGRQPLFASEQGRLHKSSIQANVYNLTQPCQYTGDCPHGRDIKECEATSYDMAAKCPSSVSPHPIRRSAITAHLNSDVPKEIASERMAVSVDTLEQHYDARTKEDKRERRKDYLGNL
jgi:site-specific recombinase XerD